jgi:hypothetical protein
MIERIHAKPAGSATHSYLARTEKSDKDNKSLNGEGGKHQRGGGFIRWAATVLIAGSMVLLPFCIDFIPKPDKLADGASRKYDVRQVLYVNDKTFESRGIGCTVIVDRLTSDMGQTYSLIGRTDRDYEYRLSITKTTLDAAAFGAPHLSLSYSIVDQYNNGLYYGEVKDLGLRPNRPYQLGLTFEKREVTAVVRDPANNQKKSVELPANIDGVSVGNRFVGGLEELGGFEVHLTGVEYEKISLNRWGNGGNTTFIISNSGGLPVKPAQWRLITDSRKMEGDGTNRNASRNEERPTGWTSFRMADGDDMQDDVQYAFGALATELNVLIRRDHNGDPKSELGILFFTK